MAFRSETRMELRSAFADLRAERANMLGEYNRWLAATDILEEARINAMRVVSADDRFSVVATTLVVHDATRAESFAAKEALAGLAAAEMNRDLALVAVARTLVETVLQALNGKT